MFGHSKTREPADPGPVLAAVGQLCARTMELRQS